MIKFSPFRGVRPAKQKAALVTTKNVDYYPKEEMEKELATNAESFLHIISPSIFNNNDSTSPTSLTVMFLKTYHSK